MSRLRVLSGLILLCAGALSLPKLVPQLFMDPLVWSCVQASTYEDRMEACDVALASDSVSEEERGRIAFGLGYAHHQHNWRKALDYYSQTITHFPAKTSAFYNRGLLWAQNAKDYESAIKDFDVVIGRMESGGKTYERVFYVRARAFRLLRKHDDAIEDYTTHLVRHPTDVPALIERAKSHGSLNNYDLAKADLDKVFSLDPLNREAFSEAFWFAAMTDNYDQVSAVVTAGLAVEPESSWLWHQSSRVHSWMGDKKQALSDINTAISLGANSATVWYQRGLLRGEAGDFRGGLEDLDKALSISPEFQTVLNAREDLLIEIVNSHEDEPKQAITLLNETLDRRPDDVHALEWRALTYGGMSLAELPAALRDINRAIGLQDVPQRSVLFRSLIYAYAGQIDAAFVDVNRVIADARFGSDAEKRLTREMMRLAATGNEDAAVEVANQQSDLWALLDDALKARSKLHISLGDVDAAIGDYTAIVDADPDDAEKLADRASFLAEVGRHEEAIADYGRAMLLIESGAADSFYPESELPAQILLERGALHQAAGDADAAVADFEAALTYDNPDVVSAFQQKMQRAGHYDGPLTDVLDTATRLALRACAADRDC